MRNLTPTVVLQFQGKSGVKETYEIILRDVVEIAKTIIDKYEIRQAKLLLKQAIAVLEAKEHHIWERENGY